MKSGATSSLFFQVSENSLWVLSFYETKQNLNLNLFQSTSEYQKRQLTNFLTFEWSKATDHVRPLGQFNPRPADVPSVPRVFHLFSFPPSIPLFTAGWAGPWRPIDLLHATVHLLWKKRKFQKLPQASNGLIIQKTKNKTWAKALKVWFQFGDVPTPPSFHPRQQNKKEKYCMTVWIQTHIGIQFEKMLTAAIAKSSHSDSGKILITEEKLSVF